MPNPGSQAPRRKHSKARSGFKDRPLPLITQDLRAAIAKALDRIEGTTPQERQRLWKRSGQFKRLVKPNTL